MGRKAFLDSAITSLFQINDNEDNRKTLSLPTELRLSPELTFHLLVQIF